MRYEPKPHSKFMLGTTWQWAQKQINFIRFTVSTPPKVTAERIKSEFTTEIKQKKEGAYLLTRAWYQSVEIKISPGPNNGTNVSVRTGYTTAMGFVLVIATLLCLASTVIISLILNNFVLGAMGFVVPSTAAWMLSKPLTEEFSTKLTHYTKP